MKKNLAIVFGLAALAGLAIVLLEKSGKKAPAIGCDSDEERQLLYGEMPGELVDFAAAKAKAQARHA